MGLPRAVTREQSCKPQAIPMQNWQFCQFQQVGNGLNVEGLPATPRGVTPRDSKS
jgi:hypothetical protein